MIDRTPIGPGSHDAEEQAARWILLLDCGLSASEQDALFDWLAADPAHATILARHRRNWKRLDKLAEWRPEHSRRPNPDLLAPTAKPRRIMRTFWVPLAAAAALALTIGLWTHFTSKRTDREGAAAVAARAENRQILADGSTVKLNDGAVVTVHFSETERRVHLERGEGFFIVAKDPARPFVVEAQGVEVRAVGTAFNVNMGQGTVDVLVAEGVVRVASPPAAEGAPGTSTAAAATVLEARQQAIISISSQATRPEVINVTRHQMQHALAWQHGMMTFDERPLAGIVAELNLLNERQLVIGDEAVAAMKFSGTIRSDNLEGFVRLLELGFDVRGEPAESGAIVLRTL